MPLELVPGATPLFDAIPADTLRAWIIDQKSLSLRGIPGMKEDRWADYHLDELQELHRKHGAITLYDRTVPCLIMARRLDWDTRILGVPSISLDHFFFANGTDTQVLVRALKAACTQWRDEGLRLLVHKASPANHGVLATMAPCGFDLLCQHLDYLSDAEQVAKLSTPLDGYEFGLARPDEEEQVAQLTKSNYAHMDRFNIDPMVPRDRVASLYYEWGRNAFHGYSEIVWVARRGGKVVGITFWSWRKKLDTITGVNCALNQLGAVDAHDAGKGVFRRMQATVIGYLHAHGPRWGTINTNVLNYPVQRSMQGIGCTIHDSTVTFRKDLQRD